MKRVQDSIYSIVDVHYSIKPNAMPTKEELHGATDFHKRIGQPYC